MPASQASLVAAELEASAARPDVPRRTLLSLDQWS